MALIYTLLALRTKLTLACPAVFARLRSTGRTGVMRTRDRVGVQLAQRKLANAITVVKAATFGGTTGHSVTTRVFAHETRMVA